MVSLYFMQVLRSVIFDVIGYLDGGGVVCCVVYVDVYRVACAICFLCVVDFVVVDGVYNIDGVVGCYCVGIISVAGHIDVTEHCIVVAGAVGMFVGCVATDVVGVVGVVCCGTFGDDVVIVAVSIYGVGGDVCVRVFGVYVNDCIFAIYG